MSLFIIIRRKKERVKKRNANAEAGRGFPAGYNNMRPPPLENRTRKPSSAHCSIFHRPRRGRNTTAAAAAIVRLSCRRKKERTEKVPFISSLLRAAASSALLRGRHAHIEMSRGVHPRHARGDTNRSSGPQDKR